MNNLFVQNSSLARLWAVLTMLAVVLSAFSAPFSVFAQEVPEVVDPTPIVDPAPTDLPDGDVDGDEDEGDGLPTTGEESLRTFNMSTPNGGPSPKVTICHANESNEQANNPFTDNDVDEDGLNGHGDHADDIIPVTDDFPNGQNLTTVYAEFGGLTGQQILDDECDTPEKEVKISITKIICEDETLLPNDGYTEITAATAANFLAENPSCYEGEGFEFQWAKGGVNTTEDNSGELGSPWTTTDETDSNGNVVITLSEKDVKNQSKISVREVWSADYIPFTGKNGSNVSAELYCANDAANFDNLEWVGQNGTLALDETYHCVAWNVPVLEEIEMCKFNALEAPIAGWEMTLTNGDQSYTLETGENGCVSKMVNPNIGPWTTSEEMQKDWEQVDVSVQNGFIDTEDEVTEYCVFFDGEVKLPITNFVEIPDTDKSCTFTNEYVEPCEDKLDGDWANSVVTSDQGLKKNGAAITDPNRTDDEKVLGVEDWVVNGSTGFFSLGFGGSVTVEFDNFVPNVLGNDIAVYEATNGTYPAETAKVEVSQNGTDWEEVGTASNLNVDRISNFDFDSTGLAWIKFVRVTDTSNPALHVNDADGFDVDAISATESLCDEPEGPKFSDVTMCKIDGNQNTLSGWNLMLLGAEVGSVSVSATNGAGTDVALAAGPYVAIASGTWENHRTPLNTVDAEYSTEDNWATNMDGFTGYGTEILELKVGGAFGDWGAYNSLHRYARAFAQVADGVTNFAVSDSYYGDNTGSLNVAVYEGYAGLTGANGCVVFEDVPFGTYNVDEIMQDGWLNASGLGEVTVDSETESFTVINRPVDTPAEEVATVVAHKIVCTDEAELPNWGAANLNNISSSTAADWVATHDSCEFEAGWEFEWAPQGTSNPDNNLPTSGLYGAAGGSWTTFGPTDVNGKTQVSLSAAQIAGMSNIWMREVLKDGYIPFTYGPGNLTNEDDYSAEIYCHTDALNYDNYDRVDGIAVDNTYYCVAWNHAEVPAPVCEAEVDLLTNGSFEDPVVTNSGLWQKFPSVTGWLIQKVADLTATTLEIHKGWSGNQAAAGLQYVELDGDHSTQVSQTVAVIPGETYDLSWAFAPRQNIAAEQNQLGVYVDGVQVESDGPSSIGTALTIADWQNGTVSFVATTSSVTISMVDAGPSNSFGTFLDDVSLKCNPDGGDDEGDGDGDNDEDDTYRLEGYIWNDDDRNTLWGEGELSLAGWTVTATKGATTYSTTTDESGYYYFDVPAGTWTISQEVQTDWEQTTTPESYEVIVPSLVTQSLVERVLAYIIPVAHAAVVEIIDDLDFGNDFIGTTPNPTSNGGGGGGGGRLVRSTPTVAGDSISTPTPMPLVLGEQVSVVPYGAPGTGHGGTSSSMNVLSLLQILFTNRKTELVK